MAVDGHKDPWRTEDEEVQEWVAVHPILDLDKVHMVVVVRVAYEVVEVYAQAEVVVVSVVHIERDA